MIDPQQSLLFYLTQIKNWKKEEVANSIPNHQSQKRLKMSELVFKTPIKTLLTVSCFCLS